MIEIQRLINCPKMGTNCNQNQIFGIEHSLTTSQVLYIGIIALVLSPPAFTSMLYIPICQPNQKIIKITSPINKKLLL